MTKKPPISAEPIHPGAVLRAEFLEPLGLSANKLAKHIGVPTNRITAILSGLRGISGDSAIRLAKAFGTTAEFWMNLQVKYDLQVANRAVAIEIEPLEAREART